jgi:hypothetical protein
MSQELSQEDVFANDIDPLDAIRELRREEGVAEEDLIVSEESSTVAQDAVAEDDTDAFEEDPAAEADLEQETDPVTAEAEGETFPDKDETDPNADLDADPEGTKTEAKAPAATTKTFKANGQEFSFTQEEMLEKFETVFGQSMDYTQKMQKIAPYRKMISALEAEGVSQEQLNVALDALKGDKGALQSILKTHDIDNYDLTPDEQDSPYSPNDYGKNETQMSIDEVTSKIENDEEYKITVNVIDEQWDNESRNKISSNPSMISGLHNDIKSGVYDEVAPAAMKMKVLDGNTKSDIEYYMLAGEQIRLQKETANNGAVDDLNKSTQDAEDKFGKASSEAKTKRAASSTRGRADRKGVIDYLDDNDDNFQAWYDQLQASN